LHWIDLDRLRHGKENWSVAGPPPKAQIRKSLFGSFSPEKELLALP
jgi:hypothetical protein